MTAVNSLPTHTTWRVYCRAKEPCEVMPRLDRAGAVLTADRHARETGHPTDVVRLRFETVREVRP